MRRRSSNRARRRGNSRQSQISPVRFHQINVTTLSGVTGNDLIALSPQSISGLVEIGDQFDLFRIQSLKYRIHPQDPTDTTVQAVVYYPDADIQTQTPIQAAESPLAAVQTPFCGVPSRWISVPRSQLKGMLDWYKCTPDAGAIEFERQGSIRLAGGLSEVTRVEFEGVILFKNPVSSSVQLSRQLTRLEKQGLIVRLPPPPPRSVTPGVKNPGVHTPNH